MSISKTAAFFGFLFLLCLNAAATVTVNITNPSSGETIYPNLGDKCTDISFTVTDSNGNAPIHLYSIYYNYGDGNTFIVRDSNLSSASDNDWTDGVDFTVNYCWSTHNPTTGAYVLDVNVISTDSTRTGNSYGEGITTFNIDNRFISTAVQSIVQTLPIVAVAGAIIAIVLLPMMGNISVSSFAYIIVSIIVTLIAVFAMMPIINTLLGG